MTMNFVAASAEGIRVPNDPSLTVATNKITLSAWVKPNAGATRVFFAKNAAAAPFSQFQLRGQNVSGTDLKVRFTFQDNSRTTATLMNLGVWNLIVGTYDGTDLRVYFDGVFDSLTNAPGLTMTDNGEDMGLGFNALDSSLGMDGELDDLRIYDRALSPNEITTMHTLRGRDNIIHGLVSRWTMRERESGFSASAAGSIKDIGPSNNNGDPAGTPTYAEGILAFGRRVA